MRSWKTGILMVIATWALLMTNSTAEEQSASFRLHVVFNNVPHKADLETSWGFACFIEAPEHDLLFDTGGDGRILLANMRRLDLDPETVETVVLSHIHGDHTGGLRDFLADNPNVTVYMPASFPSRFRREVVRQGAKAETVAGPARLTPNAFSTGEMDNTIEEQALILDTARGLVVMTGCAHPNVADMAEQAHTYLDRPIYLLMGGFHLGGSSEAEIHAIIRRLQTLGVRLVAPSHCTGDKAMRMFREAWGADFIEGGLGATIEIPH